VNDIPITLQCPKCGDKTQQFVAGLDLEGKAVCAACGHCDDLPKFVDADSVAKVAQFAIEAFLQAPIAGKGVKQKR
jgi:transcription elongation factor Elf1